MVGAELVFPGVEAGSGVSGRLLELRRVVAEDPALRAAEVRAELRPRVRHGVVEVDRFYWSARWPAPGDPLGFGARTVFWDRRDGRVRVLDFPDEPALTWLREPTGPLWSWGERSRLRILRYIPLRRVTFLLEGADGLAPRVIAKTKRTSSLVRAAETLRAADAAAGRSAAGEFVVPRPLGLDLDRRVLLLEEVPGEPLGSVFDPAAGEATLRRLGAVHRGVHELEVPGVPVLATADWVDAAAKAAEQVAALVPSVADAVRRLLGRLAATAPPDEPGAFCQGDFVPSQILCDPTGWAVLDLDDGHVTDPHAEVAALHVALPRELRLPAGTATDEARAAYLEGYQERAGRALDPDRLRWFLGVAQLRYLARRLVKGRAAPGEAPEILSQALTEQRLQAP